MGGRGKDIGSTYYQIHIDEYLQKINVNKIIEESEKTRNGMQKSGTYGRGSVPLLKKCACCENCTVPVNEKNAVCKDCGWIDDEYQNMHPDSDNGRNPISLNIAKENFARYGRAVVM
ncbi:MAG: hypothetical protein NC223_04885 [Butyrivibrio sp.]|nr:hypothetical protein [Butyrivibrio sp.]